MKFSCSLISVKDISASRKFYEDLFGLEAKYDFGANIVFSCGLSLQQGFAELAGIPSDDVVYKANNFELCFEEENFDAFVFVLKKRPEIVYLHDIIEHSWGQRVIRFYDPDGHIIEVGESMCSVVKRFLDQGLTIEETATRTQHPIDFVKSCAE